MPVCQLIAHFFVCVHMHASLLACAGCAKPGCGHHLGTSFCSSSLTQYARFRAHACLHVQSVQSMGVAIMSWEDLLNKGRSQPIPEPVPPKPEDLCTIMYTSGTTGMGSHAFSILYTRGTTGVGS